MNYLYLLLATEFFLLTFAFVITKMDYISPSVVTCAMFTLSTLCVIYNETYWDVHFTGMTYVVVSSGLLVIILTEFFVQNVTKRKRYWIDIEKKRQETSVEVSNILYEVFIIFCVILTFVFIREIRRLGGFGLSAISNVKNDDDLNISVVAKIALRIMRGVPYPCLYIFAHNVILCGDKIKNNIKLLVPVLLSLIVIFFGGSRAPYVYIAIAMVIYILMFDRYKNGWRNVDVRKYIKYIIPAIVIFMFVFVWTRSIVKGHEFSSTPLEYITFYFGSPIHLLNKILPNTSYTFKNYTLFGANCFTLFYEELYKFGLVKEYIPFNDTSFIAVGGGFVGGGNVYTMFANSYHDFGFLGMLLFCCIFYGIIDYVYYAKIKYNKCLCNHDTTLLVYGFLYYLVFLNFYTTMSAFLKFQTILEILVMVMIYKMLKKLKFK
jgi:oligosaccharide repeat unit polymerase